MRVLLVRHAPTAWNLARRFQGHADTPLDDLGRRQTARLADRLSGEPISAIYASDLRRASETAAIIATEVGAMVMLEPRLRELSFGVWEGLTLGILAGVVLGLVNGVAVGVAGINPFIATLATGIVFSGLALIVTNEQLITVNDPGFQTFGST